MISVIIPALNEQEHISSCLESLAQQDYRGRLEVIVVDNGSTDDTVAIAQSLGAKVAKQPKRGIAWARQRGFEVAVGDIIASTDADTILPHDWLWQIERLLRQNPRAVAVAGHFLLFDGPAVVRMAVRLSLSLMPFILKYIPRLWNFSGVNLAVRADAYSAVGGFNTDLEFGEDIDLCRRLRRLGPVVYEPGLLVQTSGRAFSGDRLGLRHLLGYLGVLVWGNHADGNTWQEPQEIRKQDAKQH